MVLLPLFCFTTTNAQGYESSDIIVGFKAGPVASTLTGLDGKYKFGATAAGYVQIFFLDNLAFDIELAYTQQGTNDAPRLSVPEEKCDYKLDYLNTNYIVKYYFKDNMSVYGGLNTGIILRAKAQKGNETRSLRDHIHSGDFGTVVGLEYVIKNKWTVDARWQWNPRKIAETDVLKKEIGNARHQTFSLTVGYKFQVF